MLIMTWPPRPWGYQFSLIWIVFQLFFNLHGAVEICSRSSRQPRLVLATIYELLDRQTKSGLVIIKLRQQPEWKQNDLLAEPAAFTCTSTATSCQSSLLFLAFAGLNLICLSRRLGGLGRWCLLNNDPVITAV